MDVASGLLLFGAGVAGGVITAVVGGAALITFPALMAAGLPAIVANASNAVAMTPGNFAGAVADLGRLHADRHFAGRLIAVCLLGGLAGAGPLLVTPERAFTIMVPLLIGLATVLFAAAERTQRWTRAWSERADGGPATGVVFIVQGIVAWPQALAMMGGALVGGPLGGRLVRVLPQKLIRLVVITVGTILTLVYAWRYWLP